MEITLLTPDSGKVIKIEDTKNERVDMLTYKGQTGDLSFHLTTGYSKFGRLTTARNFKHTIECFAKKSEKLKRMIKGVIIVNNHGKPRCVVFARLFAFHTTANSTCCKFLEKRVLL